MKGGVAAFAVGQQRSEAVAMAESTRHTAPMRWFAPLPVAMLLDAGLSSDAKVLAGILLHYDGPTGCRPKVESLMRDLAASKNKILRILEELERYGFLVRERRGRNNIYRLRPVYERPIRRDSFEATGDLSLQNAPRPRPERRSRLHKPRTPVAQEQVPSVEPVVLADERARRLQKVSPVEPISGCPDREKGLRQVPPVEPVPGPRRPRKVPSVTPDLVPPVEPNRAERFHPWNLDKTKNHSRSKTKHQDPPMRESADDGGGECIEEGTGQNGLPALQRAGVNLTRSELGIHEGRGRPLNDDELEAWAAWVSGPPAPGIANKPGFAAAKIRMGCSLEDVFPAVAATRRRERERRHSDDAIAAERGHQAATIAEADIRIARLSDPDRNRLRERALEDPGIRLAHGATPETFDRLILATERRLILTAWT